MIDPWKLALAAWLCLLAACANPFQPNEEEPWAGAEVEAPSENVLWTVSGMALERSGFPVGSEADPTTLVMNTGWKVNLAPFKGQGFRERASLRLNSLGNKRWRVEVRVDKETNEDIKRPMDPSMAKWESAGQDLDAADLILRRIRATLGETLPAKDAQPKAKAKG
jgi:hypothetical protein